MNDLPSLTFEQALAELQQIVAELEQGDGDLAAGLARYERGMQLARRCNDLLDQAELRVRELAANGSEHPFTGPLDSRT
ncbi:MAG: exodeoxyribonuclease VII small subunit [Caldilineales bacterium]|nr:exodeoxyribonuclease VII small subunit [Caldilineales bacterium]